MTVKGRFSLDTNVLVYAVDRDAGERHERARVLIGQAARRDCVLTVQALAEFFHATTRKHLLEPSHASAFVRDWLDVFQVASADDSVLVDAMDAVEEHRLSFWDAMLWATVRQVGCSAILTEDMQDGRRLSGVEFVDPFSADATARLAVLLEK
jgi:predicted nucleic acid-binding protein